MRKKSLSHLLNGRVVQEGLVVAALLELLLETVVALGQIFDVFAQLVEGFILRVVVDHVDKHLELSGFLGTHHLAIAFGQGSFPEFVSEVGGIVDELVLFFTRRQSAVL